MVNSGGNSQGHRAPIFRDRSKVGNMLKGLKGDEIIPWLMGGNMNEILETNCVYQTQTFLSSPPCTLNQFITIRIPKPHFLKSEWSFHLTLLFYYPHWFSF